MWNSQSNLTSNLNSKSENKNNRKKRKKKKEYQAKIKKMNIKIVRPSILLASSCTFKMSKSSQFKLNSNWILEIKRKREKIRKRNRENILTLAGPFLSFSAQHPYPTRQPTLRSFLFFFLCGAYMWVRFVSRRPPPVGLTAENRTAESARSSWPWDSLVACI